VKSLSCWFGRLRAFLNVIPVAISIGILVRNDKVGLREGESASKCTRRNIRIACKERHGRIVTVLHIRMVRLELPTHPHQLRHACGFPLADQGADTRLIQDYLGHRDIRHTVIYKSGAV
jgi:integrase